MNGKDSSWFKVSKAHIDRAARGPDISPLVHYLHGLIDRASRRCADSVLIEGYL
jgi:hypothetical protein